MDVTTRKNLKLFITSGIFSIISLNLYTPFAVKFLQRLGGDEFYISLFNSLPGFIGILASIFGGGVLSPIKGCPGSKCITRNVVSYIHSS